MQIQYELLKTTSKRTFESYIWNSRQINWKISPYIYRKGSLRHVRCVPFWREINVFRGNQRSCSSKNVDWSFLGFIKIFGNKFLKHCFLLSRAFGHTPCGNNLVLFRPSRTWSKFWHWWICKWKPQHLTYV